MENVIKSDKHHANLPKSSSSGQIFLLQGLRLMYQKFFTVFFLKTFLPKHKKPFRCDTEG